MFAHDPEAAAEAVHAVAAAGIPCWAKLSANTDRTVAVAEAVRDAGASAVTFEINTLMGVVMNVNRQTRAGRGARRVVRRRRPFRWR